MRRQYITMVLKTIIILLSICFCSSLSARDLRADKESLNTTPIDTISDIGCYFAITAVHKHLEEAFNDYEVFLCKLDHVKNTINITLQKSALSFGSISYDLNMQDMQIIKTNYER